MERKIKVGGLEIRSALNPETIKEMAIEQIINFPVHGNAHNDGVLLGLMHDALVSPEYSIEQKIKVLEKQNIVMGLDEPCNEAEIERYIEFFNLPENKEVS